MTTPHHASAQHKIFEFPHGIFLYAVNENAIFEIDEETVRSLDAQDVDALVVQGLPRRIFSQATPTPIVARTDEQERPVYSLTLMVVQECNLACLYCYGGEGEYKSRGRMTVETALEAVDLLVEKSGDAPINITFFGGEPLMNWPVIDAVVRHARRIEQERNKQVTFSMTCNGTLLDEAKTAFLREHRVGILISIDGDKEAHDGNRPQKGGRGSYEQIVQRTAPLREAGTVSARSTVTPKNADVVHQFDHLLKLGFRAVAFSPALEMMSDEAFNELSDGYLALVDRFADLVQQKDYRTARRIRNVMQFLEKIHRGGKRSHFCGAGTNMMAVDKDGTLFPCHRFVGEQPFALGSIKSGGWDSRREAFIAETHVLNRTTCGSCWARSLCTGGCHHENFAMNKSVQQPYGHYCRTTRTFLTAVFGLYVSLDEEAKRTLFPDPSGPETASSRQLSQGMAATTIAV